MWVRQCVMFLILSPSFPSPQVLSVPTFLFGLCASFSPLQPILHVATTAIVLKHNTNHVTTLLKTNTKALWILTGKTKRWLLNRTRFPGIWLQSIVLASLLNSSRFFSCYIQSNYIMSSLIALKMLPLSWKLNKFTYINCLPHPRVHSKFLISVSHYF